MEDGNGLPSLENSRRRARLCTLVTAISAALIAVVLIIILATSDIWNVEEPINKANRTGRYGPRTISSGIIVVSLVLIVCSLVHAGLSLKLRSDLRENVLWIAGAWVRCHTVWVACLVMCGLHLCISLVQVKAAAAAGGLVAAVLAAIAVGVVAGAVLRRHFYLLMPTPWWGLCNMPDCCCYSYLHTPNPSVTRVPPFTATAGGALVTAGGAPVTVGGAPVTVGGKPVTVQGGPVAPFRPKHTHPDLL